ncbi:L,D-transpeptidase [Alisedimentitalea sp. MJ-SS2]|uniref:L,D-transpeptidase n=1 Tax=Aliisedimentitalea sp. MJ-SS2 TaxID=3049795 RepID=UPI0029137218|nr:L,D-transpeptidase [Alisedimentitalea sp. MJ-SS2]MDU8927469.1 L,D-transpeptidase [Alisedimentitalea sp. MJ-SS2]
MFRLAAFLLGLLALPTLTAAGEIGVHIDLSDQEMIIALDGHEYYRWPVSTARRGKFTPVGTYRVQSMKRRHYSTLYNNAPMPWSIFFHGNFAIHGTNQTSRLGTPASAGCVRLHPDDAETLFKMVLEHGRANTWIKIRK